MRFIALAVLTVCSPSVAAAQDLYGTLEAMGAYSCSNSELTCVKVAVPQNHFGNDKSVTVEVEFAIHLADGEPQRTLVYAVGGPGFAGNYTADDYINSFDYDLLDSTNIVFFDQRGVGNSDGLTCPDAQSKLDLADLPLKETDAVLDLVRSYVDDCLVEIGPSRMLPYMATEQVVRDIDTFRSIIGVSKIWVYGESYGTQIAQEYATTFPDHVAGVILDGVVDLNASLKGFNDTYGRASSDLLQRLFTACDAMPACHRDLPNGASQEYAALKTKLANPVELSYLLGNGSVDTRSLTLGMLELSAFYALYNPSDRADLLRALAFAAQGDLVPMLDLAYWNQALDPQTLTPLPDESWFGPAYYAITCADYADETQGNPDAAARRIVDEALIAVAEIPDLAQELYLDRLICAYWPYHGHAGRPAPFAGSLDWPTLVLNSDADPITPVSMARSVFQHAQNASLVVMQGGPHVIWARGLNCPDIIVSRFFAGEAPDGKVQYCAQDLIEGYQPLTLTQPSERAEPLTVARAIVSELKNSFALQNWDANEPTRFACPKGGFLLAKPNGWSTTYEFEDCAFWPSVSITGYGSNDDDDEGDDGVWLNVTVTGEHSGTLAYIENETTEAQRVNGTWDGKAID